MTRILFVCTGNICRSPMAEFVMKALVAREGISDEFSIASAATTTEELGNPPYPPARKKMAEHGIDCSGKRARQIVRADYDDYDYLIGMEDWHLRGMQRVFQGDPEHKLHLLLDFTARGGTVSDPWYTGDFDTCWTDVEEGCRALLEHITGRTVTPLP